MNDEQNKSYKVHEAAKLLGVHEITVYRWLREGTLKGIRLGPKLWRIPAAELQRLRTPTQEVPA
jgi:excisionase family DNA binding protein